MFDWCQEKCIHLRDPAGNELRHLVQALEKIIELDLPPYFFERDSILGFTFVSFFSSRLPHIDNRGVDKVMVSALAFSLWLKTYSYFFVIINK